MAEAIKNGNNLLSQSDYKIAPFHKTQSNNIVTARPYSAITQKLLNWFVFFLAFPAIELFGNSITFYLFIAIIVRIGSFWTGSFKGKMLLVSFLLMAFVSTLSAPYMPRHPGFFASVKILVQYAYWIFVGLFFISQKNRINFLQLSKWVLFGIIAASLSFYFFNTKYSSPVIEIDFGASRNTFVFNLLCCIPISFYYLLHYLGKKGAVWLMPVYIMVMLLTGGRSGAVLIILQMVLVAAIIYPTVQRAAKIMIPVFGLLYFISQSDSFQIYLDAAANQVESFNPRFANLLRGEEDGDLTSDKSWLVRKLMVDKGVEIFKDYPLRGIGPNNFDFYDSKLATYYKYDRLSGASVEFFNSRSAHNSYVQLLAEMGLPGCVLMVLLLALPLLFFLKKFFLSKMTIQYLPFVSLLGISMHFYAISALTGAIAWLIIGLAWGILNNSKKVHQ